MRGEPTMKTKGRIVGEAPPEPAVGRLVRVSARGLDRSRPSSVPAPLYIDEWLVVASSLLDDSLLQMQALCRRLASESIWSPSVMEPSSYVEARTGRSSTEDARN